MRDEVIILVNVPISHFLKSLAHSTAIIAQTNKHDYMQQHMFKRTHIPWPC